MRNRLSIILSLLAAPCFAQSPPSAPEIIAALVRQAPQLDAVDHAGNPAPGGATATGFLTQVIFELGIYAPQTEDRYTFSATCEPSETDGEWECTLGMSVHWSGAESALLARFAMIPSGQSCDTQFIDVHGDYDPCAWAIRDSEIMLQWVG